MKTFFVPVVFQGASIRALRYIEDVFREKPVRLNLLHVISADNGPDKKEVEKEFQKFESKVLKDYTLPYELNIQRGNLLDEIQKAINNTQPSMVIIATSGQKLSKAFVKLTNCPVLIVPENNNKSRIRNIAYANDFHEVKASAAFETLLDLCKNIAGRTVCAFGDAEVAPIQSTLKYWRQEYVDLINEAEAANLIKLEPVARG